MKSVNLRNSDLINSNKSEFNIDDDDYAYGSPRGSKVSIWKPTLSKKAPSHKSQYATNIKLQLLFNSNRHKECLALANEILDECEGWNSQALYIKCSILYSRGGLYNDCLVLSSRCVKMNPNDRLILEQQGKVYCQLGLYEDSINAFKKSIECSGEPDWNIHYLLSETYLKEENYHSAMLHLKESTRISPNVSPLPYVSLLRISIILADDFDIVMKLYKDGINLFPNCTELKKEMAFYYIKLLTTENSNNTNNNSNDGTTTTTKAYKKSMAIQLFEEIVTIQTTTTNTQIDPDVILALGSLLPRQKALEKYSHYYSSKQLKSSQNDTFIDTNIASVLYEKGDYIKSIAYLKSAILNTDYSHWEMIFGIGLCYFGLGIWNRAHVYLSIAFKRLQFIQNSTNPNNNINNKLNTLNEDDDTTHNFATIAAAAMSRTSEDTSSTNSNKFLSKSLLFIAILLDKLERPLNFDDNDNGIQDDDVGFEFERALEYDIFDFTNLLNYALFLVERGDIRNCREVFQTFLSVFEQDGDNCTREDSEDSKYKRSFNAAKTLLEKALSSSSE